MEDEAGGKAVVKVVGTGDGDEVASTDVEVFDDAVADAEEGFDSDVAFVGTIGRGFTSDFEMEVEEPGVGGVTMAIVAVRVARAAGLDGFDQTEADAKFCFIGIKSVFEKDLGIQGEVVSEVEPGGKAGGEGGFTTK